MRNWTGAAGKIPLWLACLLTTAWMAGNTIGADVVLLGGKVYPSPAQAPIEDAAIVIHDGRIAAVGPRSKVSLPRNAETVDCTGLVVTAGFWNSHVHILTPGLLDARASGVEPLQGDLDTMFNRWGFTTVFDLGSALDNTLALRRRIESGDVNGPRILTTGEPIWTIEPVYIRDFLSLHHIDIPRTGTPDQAIALVRDHAAKGADGIKLFTGSYQGDGKVATLPLAIAKAGADEAHRHHLPVFAHPQDVAGVEVAISAGVDVLAHTVPQSPPWTAAFVERLKHGHLALIPTLTLFDYEARKETNAQPSIDAWLAQMVAELRAYSDAGGDILFGTDIGYTDHYDTALEFSLMSQAGMTYRQILASLTTRPAGKFGYASRSGRVEKGLDADLVVLSADPSRDVRAFSRVRLTIRRGHVTFRTGLGGLIAVPDRSRAVFSAEW